jgi:hypothetical protein
MQTLKVEDVDVMDDETYDEAATGLPRFIEKVGNRRRLHWRWAISARRRREPQRPRSWPNRRLNGSGCRGAVHASGEDTIGLYTGGSGEVLLAGVAVRDPDLGAPLPHHRLGHRFGAPGCDLVQHRRVAVSGSPKRWKVLAMPPSAMARPNSSRISRAGRSKPR